MTEATGVSYLTKTSDHLVRGISRSNDHAALQADLDYASSAGLVVGMSASKNQIGADEYRDLEASALVATSFVNTSSRAKSLFYIETQPNRWLVTVIWRFCRERTRSERCAAWSESLDGGPRSARFVYESTVRVS